MASINNAKAIELLNRMFAVEMAFINSDRSDYSGIQAVFHTDIIVHEPASLPYRGDWRGYDGLGRLFEMMHDSWDKMTVENMHSTIDGDTLYMGGTLVAVARLTGKEIRQPFAEILRIKDGLVIEGYPFYYDTVAINMALNSSHDGV